ncbi:MAG: DUF4173 domain-containing protein [Clostridia bacterium]|nr:DUF4173 domain-containing protein [Clostridia bacterium]
MEQIEKNEAKAETTEATESKGFETAVEEKASDAQATPVLKAKAPKYHRSFTGHEALFAWISCLAGYLFCLAFPLTESAIGGTLFTAFIFIATGIVFAVKKVKFSGTAVFAAVSAVAISVSLSYGWESPLNIFTGGYAFAAYCYFVYSATENSLGKPFSNLIVFDLCKSLLTMPFGALKDFELFRALAASRKSKGTKYFAYLLVGIVVAIIPASLALSLLSYDEGFKEIVDKIFSFNSADIGYHISCLVFGIPVGMYIFSLFISGTDKKQSRFFTKENFIKVSDKIKIAPLVTVLAAVIPLLAVYVVFFISQKQYYISGFTGVLPDNFSYAQYAREGFFELCKVSVINLTVIVLITQLIKKGKANAITVKILTVVFSAVTFLLMATAMSKLVMYINRYGLTQKRVYAAWFMAVIAVIFLIITLSRFIKKISWIPACACVVIVAFAGLSLCNVDRQIAKFNVDRYIDGTVKVVDVDALDSLGDAAVPEMAKLIKHLDEKNGTDFKEHSLHYYVKLSNWTTYNTTAHSLLLEAKIINEDREMGFDQSIFSYSFNKAQAEKALEELGLLKAE